MLIFRKICIFGSKQGAFECGLKFSIFFLANEDGGIRLKEGEEREESRKEGKYGAKKKKVEVINIIAYPTFMP